MASKVSFLNPKTYFYIKILKRTKVAHNSLNIELSDKINEFHMPL